MADELKDILSNLNKDIEQEKLLQYLNKSLPDAEQHAVERQMNEDAFINDAMEGLEQIKDKQHIPMLVHELNAGLKKQLEKKKKRREKRQLKEQPWIYFAIILILLMLVITYLVIKKSS